MRTLRSVLAKIAVNSVIGLAITGFTLSTGWCSPEYRAVTILHTNDTHGHLLPFSYPEPRSATDEYAALPYRINIGGIARRATLARQIEQEMRGNVLLVDAGDALDGTPFSIEYMGEADFAAMDAAGYDIRTNGNHEFSASTKEFMRNLQAGSFMVVDANLIDRKSGNPALPLYNIFEVNGAKIAIFGLTTPAPTYKAAKESFDFADPIMIARQLVPYLQQQADIVIALTHLGIDDDIKLAKEVPGIDVIVGGHSHTRLAKPMFIQKETETQAFKVSGTVIVQGYQWGGELGRLDLRLRRDGGKFSVMSYNGQLIPVTSSIPDDLATAKVVAKYYKPMAKYYDEVLGNATATFYMDNKDDNPILNMICDAMREKTNTDAAIYNTGGIRADIVKGQIKMLDIATVFPFRNNIMVIELSGARLKKALQELKPGVSGIRYRVENDKLVEATINGKPIDDNATYKVSTIDFLVNFAFTDVQSKKDLGINYRGAVKDYIKARKNISPVTDGRRVVTGSKAPV